MTAYLAAPEEWPPGPAVVVVQEWWGLNDDIKDISNRFAGEGFAAIAPDLYRGRQPTEPDELRKTAMSLDRAQVVDDLKATVRWALEQGATAVGAVGFCMGGSLVWELAHADDRLAAAVPFYGAADVRGRELLAPLLAHFGGADHSIDRERRASLIEHLEAQSKPHEAHVYEGAPHAFFNRTRDTYREDAATLAWERTLAFLREHVAGSAPA